MTPTKGYSRHRGSGLCFPCDDRADSSFYPNCLSSLLSCVRYACPSMTWWEMEGCLYLRRRHALSCSPSPLFRPIGEREAEPLEGQPWAKELRWVLWQGWVTKAHSLEGTGIARSVAEWKHPAATRPRSLRRLARDEWLPLAEQSLRP